VIRALLSALPRFAVPVLPLKEEIMQQIIAVCSRLLFARAMFILLPIAMASAPGAPALAQPAATVHEIPHSIRLQHEEDIRVLGDLARDKGGVGRAARAALDLLQRHHARENEYILPPLTLMPAIATGAITKDMSWAIAMADKLKATREEVFFEHAAITDAMNDLLFEANLANNDAAAEFAMGAVADSLSDMEVQEPASILVGEILRIRLASQ
jgi:hypothetical protein